MCQYIFNKYILDDKLKYVNIIITNSEFPVLGQITVAMFGNVISGY
jgi:hypothetical protein